jgi:hypothetical protein
MNFYHILPSYKGVHNLLENAVQHYNEVCLTLVYLYIHVLIVIFRQKIVILRISKSFEMQISKNKQLVYRSKNLKNYK